MTTSSPRPDFTFPDGFLWGAAAASYQIEGAASHAGKGPSVWDMMVRKPGAIWQGNTGDVACDHHSRVADDVALMKRIGLRAYRGSVAWPRVLPNGVGAANEAGLDFYDRLVDELLKASIEPWFTLFHWDFPLALYHRGGWLNRDSADWFAEYADVVARRLGDRVQHWFTLNEPQVYIGHGHQDGRHAPGDQLRFAEVLRAGHHTLLAHGRAVQALRAASSTAKVGYAPVALIAYPASDAPEDVAAARAMTFGIRDRNAWNNTWWMDPAILGTYPEVGLECFGSDAPEVHDGDLAVIRQPLDFLGVNLYQGRPVRAGADGLPEFVELPVGHEITAFDWVVTPEIMNWGPRFLMERYGLPIVVTENGLSCRDWVSTDGRVHDPTRIDFTLRYLRALHAGIRAGADVRGYFHWSIMDNFEWAEGYKHRFGLTYVDYRTQERTLKDSAYWYRNVIETNGAHLAVDDPWVALLAT